jgi:hypothetical protein
MGAEIYFPVVHAGMRSTDLDVLAHDDRLGGARARSRSNHPRDNANAATYP